MMFFAGRCSEDTSEPLWTGQQQRGMFCFFFLSVDGSLEMDRTVPDMTNGLIRTAVKRGCREWRVSVRM